MDTCIQFVRYGGYWFTLLIFALFLILFYDFFRNEWKYDLDFFKKFFKKTFWSKKENWGSLVIVLFCFYFIRIQEPTEYKVIMDEPVLLATSMSMHMNREIITPTKAHRIDGVFTLVDGYTDKRPNLFPFLTSLLHDFTGYRTHNIFVVNFILTALFLAVSYWLGFLIASRIGGISSCLLFANIPLLIQTSNGGGFELLNTFLIALAIVLSFYYLRNPSNRGMSLLCMTGVLLSQARYESILYIIPLGIIMILGWVKAKRVILFSLWVYVTPLLMIPYLWQHKVFDKYQDHWQLADKDFAHSPFSFDYFNMNWGHAIHFFFSPSAEMPNNMLLALAGIIALCWFIVYAVKCFIGKPWQHKTLELEDKFDFLTEKTLLCTDNVATDNLNGSNPNKNESVNDKIKLQVLSVFFIGFLLNWILLMVYFYGQLDSHLIYRLALPLYIPLILALVYALNYLKANLWWRHLFFAFILLSLIAFTLPKTTQAIYSKSNIAAQEVRWVRAFINKHKDERMFFIAELPSLWISEGIEAISFSKANLEKEAIQFYMDQPNNPPIYVFKRESYIPYKKIYRDRGVYHLDEAFKLEPITFYSAFADNRAVIYRLISIDGVESRPIQKYKNSEEYRFDCARNLP